MKIAVNARFLLKDRLEGIGRFTNESFRILAMEHPDVKFYFLFDRPYSKEFIYGKNVIPVVLNPPARHPVLWYVWFEFSVKRFLKKNRVDLFVSPDGYVPLDSEIPALSVIHDLNFEHRPKDIPWLTRRYYQMFFPKFADYSKRIATVSNYSKNDIVNTYGINRDKVDVVYNGVSDGFQQVNNRIQENTRHRISGGKPYFIYVGALHPRKNIGNLLLAFDAFCKHSTGDYALVIVGKPMFSGKEMQQTYNQLENKHKVLFTGRVKDDELKNILASAYAMVFVPYFEGFGIPVIEAMKCGIPVIASNVTSLPEVIGEAGMLVDPSSPDEIAEAMGQLSINKKLRENLISLGLKKCETFSWQNTADGIWSSILNCVENG